MQGYISDARCTLSQIEVRRRREPVGQAVGVALPEVAEACENAAQTGRVVDRHLRLVIDDVQDLDAKVSLLPVMTQQDQIDNVALRARLATLQDDLVATRPLLEQAVVRLGWAADYAHQAAGGPAPETHLLLDQAERRLVGAAEAGGKLREHLTRAHADSERACRLADALCQVATVRMASHRDRDHCATANDGTTTPGVAR